MRNIGFVCIGILIAASFAQADTIKINSFSSTTSATIFFDDGNGHSGMASDPLAQINVTYSGSAGTFTFNTFSIDLLHDLMAGQSYNVTVRNTLTVTNGVGFVNANQMAYVFQQFGLSDLSGNPDQAAAVQTALWDLSLNNHTPTSFAMDADGTYSSGDESIFKVDFNGNPDAAAIAALTNLYLTGAAGAQNQNGWLDGGPAGQPNTGQSLLIPPSLLPALQTPEPSTFTLLVLGMCCLGAERFRRRLTR